MATGEQAGQAGGGGPARVAGRPGGPRSALLRWAGADRGRLVMVPAAAVVALIDLAALARGGAGAAGLLRLCGSALAGAFYLLIIWCYLRRPPATATSSSVTAHAAAVTATMAPFAFPLLPLAAVSWGRVFAGDILLVAGLAGSLWALGSLGRNLSVLAQARAVVQRGPYRWLRHPLYLAEMVSSLGLTVIVGTVPAVAVWLALCGLQVYRAVREEQVLLRSLPAYRDYRNRTAALLPGVF